MFSAAYEVINPKKPRFLNKNLIVPSIKIPKPHTFVEPTMISSPHIDRSVDEDVYPEDIANDYNKEVRIDKEISFKQINSPMINHSNTAKDGMKLNAISDIPQLPKRLLKTSPISLSKSLPNNELIELKERLVSKDLEYKNKLSEAKKKFQIELDTTVRRHRYEMEENGFYINQQMRNSLILCSCESNNDVIKGLPIEKTNNCIKLNNYCNGMKMSEDMKKKKNKILARQKQEIVEITSRWGKEIEKITQDAEMEIAPLQNRICSITNEMDINESILLYIPTGPRTPDPRYTSPFVSFKRRPSDGCLMNSNKKILRPVPHP